MRNVLTIGILSTLCFMQSAANGQLVGLWEFENAGDLAQATVGSNLVVTGTAVAVAGSGGPDTGAAQLGNGDFFTVTNSIGANGGGANTNAYTLVMDVQSPGTAWNALVDIDGDAFSSDGEVFTNPSGGLGIDGDYFGTGADGSFHRIALVFDMASGSSMTTYIDGALNHAHTDAELGGSPNADIDGRWSLLSTFNAFSDNGGGEEETLSVSNLALFSSALGADEVAALGGAGRILVPEPSSFGMAVFAGLLLIGRRRRSR
ncbi:MAG: hypothetical protein KDB27_21455 [Planctomycetales bacterium]|nr:hypothetical protein [Planctomycetales bacterium]